MQFGRSVFQNFRLRRWNFALFWHYFYHVFGTSGALKNSKFSPRASRGAKSWKISPRASRGVKSSKISPRASRGKKVAKIGARASRGECGCRGLRGGVFKNPWKCSKQQSKSHQNVLKSNKNTIKMFARQLDHFCRTLIFPHFWFFFKTPKKWLFLHLCFQRNAKKCLVSAL